MPLHTLLDFANDWPSTSTLWKDIITQFSMTSNEKVSTLNKDLNNK